MREVIRTDRVLLGQRLKLLKHGWSCGVRKQATAFLVVLSEKGREVGINQVSGKTAHYLYAMMATYRFVEQLEVQVDGAHAGHVERHSDGLAAQAVAVERHLGRLSILRRAKLH